VLRASAAAERAGYPTVSIVSTGFLQQAEVVARGLGLPDMPIAHYPGVPMTDSVEQLRVKVEQELVPAIIAGISAHDVAKRARAAESEPAPRDIVFNGTLDEVNEHFYGKLWSDGLPIIPPTIERVEKFLEFTERAPEQVIGICPPDNREATVWNIALTGVMAGCRPEYMPVLIAVIEAVTDPEYRMQDAGSTPGWESLVIVNGPIVKQLDFNYGASVMRVGRQANTSVGRFLRLFLRNLAGFRIAPGAGDKGSIGQSFLVALAEDEDSVRDIGWQPFSVERGFNAGDNIVTVQSVVGISPPTYSGSEKAIEHARIIAEVIGGSMTYWSPVGLAFGKWHPLLLLGPSIAKVFAQDGWSKDDLREYLYDNVKMMARDAERYAYYIGLTDFTLANKVEQGIIPHVYHDSDDPERLIPVFPRPGEIGIVVAGDPGRNQSKGYCNNHLQGPPVSKKVVLPRNWEKLLAR
jgi:hypothetical protein